MQSISIINMEKKQIYTILYVVMIITVIVTCCFLVSYLYGESASCLKDPIQYYENITGQMCYCTNGLGWLNPTG